MAEVEVQDDEQLADEIVAALEAAEDADPFETERCPLCGLHHEDEDFVAIEADDAVLGLACRYCVRAHWDVDVDGEPSAIERVAAGTRSGLESIAETANTWANVALGVAAAMFVGGIAVRITDQVATALGSVDLGSWLATPLDGTLFPVLLMLIWACMFLYIIRSPGRV